MPSQINVAKDFARTPGPCFVKQGPNSGELFRRSLLSKALRNSPPVTVVLDGTEGFGSSWIDEAFGGLVREEEFSRDFLRMNLHIISQEDPLYADEALDSIKKASIK